MLGSANNFYDKFSNAIKGKDLPVMHSVMAFFGVINDPRVKQVCFVEGKDDEIFYSKTLYKKMNAMKNDVFYIHNGEIGGKESVVNTYKFFLNNKNGSSVKKARVFIVDKDYDGLDQYDLGSEDKNHITMLPCYSFENYYVYENNLKIIFKRYFKNHYEMYVKEFKKDLLVFIDSIIRYCSWKRITIIYYNELKNRLNSIHKDSLGEIENILSIYHSGADIKMDPYFAKFIDYAINELYQKADKKIVSEYNKFIEISKGDIRLIKGKILFNFLVNYILKYHRAERYELINEMKEQVSADFDLDIDINIF